MSTVLAHENGDVGEQPVDSVAGAVALFKRLRPLLCDAGYDFNEVWCRGQADASWELSPGILRPKQGLFDESSMLHDFRILAPENHASHRTLFDWLCLMQHYDMPTRLLDWSENFFVALYFAALADEPAPYGRVFLLSPRRLNDLSDGDDQVHALVPNPRYPEGAHSEQTPRPLYVPDSFHVGLRASMARARTFSGWLRELRALDCFGSSRGAEVLERLDSLGIDERRALGSLASKPIAVQPNRFNRRLIAQAGTFTLHGGKCHGERLVHRTFPEGDGLPPPRSLQELCNESAPERPFLVSFRVTKSDTLRRELEDLGVHEATLFPELDHQAAFLKRRWRHQASSSAQAAAVPRRGGPS